MRDQKVEELERDLKRTKDVYNDLSNSYNNLSKDYYNLLQQMEKIKKAIVEKFLEIELEDI